MKERLPYARRGFHYNNYKYYLEDRFGERVQRVSIEGGFTCPNRDGTRGKGGCIYCNSQSFSPPYADKLLPIEAQLSEGIRFLHGRFGANKFIAYFQNYTNTYAPVRKLELMYRKALEHPHVVGLAVSTRPDCVENDVLQLLKDISADYDVNLELGIESLKETSLKWMNRQHTVETTRSAIRRAAEFGLNVTGHLILGLPTETREEMLAMTEELNELPLKFLKLHHLQVISKTRLAALYHLKPFPLFEYRDYVEFTGEYITRLRPEIILQRVITSSPEDCLIAPVWEPTTTAFIMDLQKYMRDHNMYQGDRYLH
ncbi:MAG: TIGR01212 family radical SAM protein [Candidatus Marinimicrobia bacterium]|nr:TIGR01212 family radical SAM protein [Candidatus Neomarinimicrobiota bacterium]